MDIDPQDLQKGSNKANEEIEKVKRAADALIEWKKANPEIRYPPAQYGYPQTPTPEQTPSFNPSEGARPIQKPAPLQGKENKPPLPPVEESDSSWWKYAIPAAGLLSLFSPKIRAALKSAASGAAKGAKGAASKVGKIIKP